MSSRVGDGGLWCIVFEFGVLLIPPELKTSVIGLIVLTKLHGVLKCVLLGFRTLLALDLFVCTGKVGPTCCFGIRFVGFFVMAYGITSYH